jgi:hypothetical protein
MLLAEKFAYALEAKFNAGEVGKDYPRHYTLEVERGVKFDRIVISSTLEQFGSGQRMVHAFVERATGAVIKPAGYKAPAKLKSGWATKYNLITEFEKTLEVADQYGGYLYQ